MYYRCAPIVISALTVLLLGMWNPALLQKRVGGKPNGVSDPKWVALASLVTGLGSCLVIQQVEKDNILPF